MGTAMGNIGPAQYRGRLGMVRAHAKLNDRWVRTAKPVGKIKKGANAGKARDSLLLSDGGGLYAQITLGKDGSIRRSWIFRYSRAGATRDMGLGSLNTLSLAKAREKATKYRELLLEGRDPLRERDAEKAKNLAASSAVMTFQEAAEKYVAQHRAGWKNPVHAHQWPASLKRYVFPIIGKMNVADVDTPHVRKVLDPIWHDKPETASRVRGRIEQVLGWATVGGYRKDERGHDKPNPARWAGHLKTSLPSPTKVRKVKPQSALPYAEMPTFMAELRGREGVAALALEFLCLTCVRTADVRGAKWRDIDRAKRVWTIPAMSKTGLPHKVPLSDAAMAVIQKVEKMIAEIGGAVANSEFVFPSDATGAPISVGAMLKVIERLGRKNQMTAHGLRAGFRTWALERSNFPWELCEISLGHKVGSKVERAYQRGDGLEKRVAIMQAWANFCAKPDETGKVVPLQRAAT
jgi:integrase